MLRKILHWLSDNGKIILYAVGALVAAAAGIAMFSRKWAPGESPSEKFQTKREVVKAQAKARELEIALGTEKAAVALEARHRADLAKLSTTQKQKAERLRSDPRALARYLVEQSRVRRPGT